MKTLKPVCLIAFLCFLLFLVSSAKGSGVDTTFFHIYNTILATKCANPACHDGSFEPDYRTLTSSYNTLVYHPVKKNNNAHAYEYRVIPYDTAKSVLYARISNCCFVNENDRMPFTVGITLADEEIKEISKWILTGAKDLHGQVKKFVNNPPLISTSYFAFGEDTVPLIKETNRIDKLFYRPFKVISSLPLITINFNISDDVSKQEDIKNAYLKLNKDSMLSNDSLIIPLKLIDGNWKARINPSTLVQGSTYYFTVGATDPITAELSFFPNARTELFIKHSWSFIIVP